MENASKALIIAGGMLIAMLIVGLLVWGFGRIRETQQTQVDQESIQEITDFNERFEAYNRTTVRGYQMISLANLVYDTNSRYTEADGYNPVTVTVDGLSSADATNEDLVTYIQTNYDRMNSNQKNALKELVFECTGVEYDTQNSRVLHMTFRRLTKVN
mgnify:FL=1